MSLGIPGWLRDALMALRARREVRRALCVQCGAVPHEPGSPFCSLACANENLDERAW